MTDHAHVECAPPGRQATERLGRLIDDVQLGAIARGYRVAEQIMQPHEGIGEIQRPQRRFGLAVQEPIDVGASQAKDQEPIRMARAKPCDRLGAPPGMQGDHEIGGFVGVGNSDPNPMAKVAQQPRPSCGGRSISRP